MIRLEGLSKTFEGDHGTVDAVQDVSFEVATGELCVLLGPSGCGKTTLLKMINRLIPRSAGKIIIDGRDTDTYDAIELRRHIGYVIQEIGLFPNMTVEQNITVVPRMLGWPAEAQRERARELLRMVAIEESYLGRYPKELSGGQQQRVGLARGLAGDPPVLLMDEPFGAVDPINRASIQDAFLKMQADLKKTILFVSHDIDEAIKMGDKIAIFRDGRLIQFGPPDDVLSNPIDDFVADFVGGDRELKRMRLIKVGAVLDAEVPTVRNSDALTIATEKLHRTGRRFVVVVDENNRPQGTLTAEEAGAAEDRRCGEVKHPLVSPITALNDLRTAVSRMFADDTKWLAVVDDEGRFLGVITEQAITDVLHESRHDVGKGTSA
ncbi:MAG: ABC transporter ATP-binding protein [Alphaproteobacteria bacterium]|nr:ABC transporter ATP-binding protein [Alphaproteobacteria bacterium]